MNILISGGAKNGKSYYAQKLAKQMSKNTQRPLYYIATMIPRDEEDHARIRRHLAERAGWGFETLERGTDLKGLFDSSVGGRQPVDREQMDSCKQPVDRELVTDPETETRDFVDPGGVFLLDSVTALLSNEMFRVDSTEQLPAGSEDSQEAGSEGSQKAGSEGSRSTGSEDSQPAGSEDSQPAEAGKECQTDSSIVFTPDLQAAERVAAECTAFAKATGNTVFVSDYIYGDADRYDTMTEGYRRGLAMVDRALAKVCDRVIEVSAGVIEEWK